MVHSLCRAGTASAALLNGNQQANPASGSADDKGMPKRLQQRQGSREICKNVSATNRQMNERQRSKKCLSKNPPSKAGFHRTDTTRLPSVIKKAMPHGIGENNESRSSNQNRRKPQRATPQNLLEPNPRTLRQRNPAVPHRHRPHHPKHRRPPRMLALQHRFRHESPRTYPKNTHHPRKHEEKTPRITPR